MLQEFIEKMCADLEISPTPRISKEKTVSFVLNSEIEVDLRELESGFAMQAKIALCPEKRREELFMWLMRANFLGQGTAGSRIGLDTQEKFLTLSLGLPYEVDYRAFKQHLEEFVNYLVYWRDQIGKFEQEKPLI
ncbi:MAG: type III secretion system chaperone [Chlamydiae bacterium]|nr:type III secretion system chaperone [Chlamydiota bacterium]